MRKLILISFLLFTSLFSFSQELGLMSGLNINYNDNKQYSPSLTSSSGLYFSLPLYKRLGIISGLNFNTVGILNKYVVCTADCICPRKIKVSFQIFEIPLFLSISLLKNEKYLPSFIIYSGYTYGRHMQVIHKSYYDYENRKEIIFTDFNSNKNVFIFNSGMEIGYSIVKKLSINFGLKYSYLEIFTPHYGGISQFYLYTKLGYKFVNKED